LEHFTADTQFLAKTAIVYAVLEFNWGIAVEDTKRLPAFLRRSDLAFWQAVLQNSFWIAGTKFSEPWM
jgi:hypothetical protein